MIGFYSYQINQRKSKYYGIVLLLPDVVGVPFDSAFGFGAGVITSGQPSLSTLVPMGVPGPFYKI